MSQELDKLCEYIKSRHPNVMIVDTIDNAHQIVIGVSVSMMHMHYMHAIPVLLGPILLSDLFQDEPEIDHQASLLHDAVVSLGNLQFDDAWLPKNPYHTSNRYRPAYKNRQIRRWLSGGKFPSRNRVKVKP
jgi:hypothetical protein